MTDFCGTGLGVVQPIAPVNGGTGSGGSSTGGSGSGSGSGGFKTVDDLLNALAGRIETSAFAEELRTRIAKIETLSAGLNQINSTVAIESGIVSNQLLGIRQGLTDALAYIDTQRQIMVNSNTALATSTNTAVAQLNGALSAAVQQTTKAVADLEKGLSAEWYVKTDLNGIISGFGLSSMIDPTGQYTSLFRVSATNFSIAPPTVNSPSAPTMPYNGMVWKGSDGVTRYYNAATAQWTTSVVVGDGAFYAQQTPIYDNQGNVVVPPGIYMNSAYVKKITADQIDTRGLTIKNSDGQVILSAGGVDWANVTMGNTNFQTAWQTIGAQIDKKSITFYEPNPPTGTMINGVLIPPDVGDTWFDVDDQYKMYVWNGSAWSLVQDSASASAAAAAAGLVAGTKITTFYTPQDPYLTLPQYTRSVDPVARKEGDLWYVDSEKLLRRWSGANWVPVASEGATFSDYQGTAGSIRGQLSPNNIGVYMATATVDTLFIAGNAVTVPANVTGDGWIPSTTVDLSVPGKIGVHVMCNWISTGGSGASAFLAAKCDGEYGPVVRTTLAPGASGSLVAFANFNRPYAGSFNITFEQHITTDPYGQSPASNYYLGPTGVFAVGVKR